MLEIRQLDAFYGDAQALWDVTLDVGAGETVSLIGPNGAGKSTLVASVAGLHASARGRIGVGGVDVLGLPAHRVCAHGVAIVPEGRRIFGRHVGATTTSASAPTAARPGPRTGESLDRGVRAVPPAVGEVDAAAPAACRAASSRCWPSAAR